MDLKNLKFYSFFQNGEPVSGDKKFQDHAKKCGVKKGNEIHLSSKVEKSSHPSYRYQDTCVKCGRTVYHSLIPDKLLDKVISGTMTYQEAVGKYEERF